MRPLDAREKNIFIVCIAMLAFYGAYHFFMAPLNEKIGFLRREIAVREEQCVKDAMVIARSRQWDEPYEAYLKQFHPAGTNAEMMSSVLSDIEKVAGVLGLRVTDLKPGKIQNIDMGHTLSVGLTINSELIDMVRFLYVMQQKPYYFHVEEIKIEQSALRGREALTSRLVVEKMFIVL